jgi:MerR family mercuric resistance operon transcriptional regulator
MQLLTIGQLAKSAGVGVETIRYYERLLLLRAPARRPSGYRLYSGDALKRLLFIRRGKELGFTLKEIQELLEINADPKSTSSDVRAFARAKIRDIDARMESLACMKAALERLLTRCKSGRPTSECPILDALGRDEAGDCCR